MFVFAHFFQGKFHGNPMHVAVVISNCLREERRILAAANMPVQVIVSELAVLLSPWTQFLWNRNSYLLSSQLLLPMLMVPPSFQSLGIKVLGSSLSNSFSLPSYWDNYQGFLEFISGILSIHSFLFPLVTLWPQSYSYQLRNIVNCFPQHDYPQGLILLKTFYGSQIPTPPTSPKLHTQNFML